MIEHDFIREHGRRPRSERELLTWRGDDIERRMKRLVKECGKRGVPVDEPGFDPLRLLDDPQHGAKLRELGAEWQLIKLRLWAIYAGDAAGEE